MHLLIVFPLSIAFLAGAGYFIYHIGLHLYGWAAIAAGCQTAQISTIPTAVYIIALLIALAFVGSVATYLIPHILINNFYFAQNLKKKYNARWAVITGSSSGIGKALAERLAQQGLNIVLVALQDKLLDETFQTFKDKYPEVQFRAVGVDLTKGDYERVVAERTQDIDVQVCFLNAGYIVLGGYGKTDVGKHLANVECNVMSGLKIGHVFIRRMMEKKLKGCVCFTSSAAHMFPAPMQTMYSSGKNFVSAFAAALAIECYNYGIDVTAIHPGPMATNFYNANVAGKVPKLDSFKPFLLMAQTPAQVAEIFLRAVGRVTWLDTGAFTIVMRVMMKLLEVNSMVAVMKRGLSLSSDFKKHKDLL